MSADPSIQHKAPFKTEAGFAFENEKRVPVVLPTEVEAEPADALKAAVDEARSETLRLVFELILADGADAAEAGLRCHLLAWAAGCHPARPESQSSVADAAGVSQASVCRELKKNAIITNVFKPSVEVGASDLNKSPHK